MGAREARVIALGIQRLVYRSTLGALVIALLVSGQGCRARASVREARLAARLKSAESRVHVVVGHTLVMPVSLEGAITPTKSVPARLDDGRKIAAGLFWVGLSAEQANASWLPPAGKWTSTPSSAGKLPAGGGTWVVVTDLPSDAIGQGLWFGNQRTALNWLPSPEHIRPREASPDLDTPLGSMANSPTLLRIAESAARSPITRWRHRLMTTGLGARGDGSGSTDRFTDPVLEALACQMEVRWQVALTTLWAADPSVAELVKKRLVNVVNFGEGVIAPAWPVDESDLDTLLADLLNARLQPAQQVDRARAWLESQPAAAAWVMDDGGQRDAMTGQVVATIGVANLTDREVTGWTSAAPDEPPSDLVPIKSQAAASLIASLSPVADGALELPKRTPVTTTQVQVNVGRWSELRPTFLRPTGVFPPGLRLEPLRREWDMLTWIGGGAPAPLEDAWAGGALLCRAAVNGDAAGRQEWVAFVECRSPVFGQEEKIRLWVGAFGAPSAIINVGSDGSVKDEIAVRQGLGAGVAGLVVSRQGDTWTAHIPIPERCIERDGTIRIGLQRTDAIGRRSSWPRPMLPWQNEPGRITVNTSTWDGSGPTKAARVR